MSADLLDSPVVPKSSPDFSRLQGIHFSGLPIQLRILINEDGQVQDVITLASTTSDMAAIGQITSMFMETTYIPGLLHGKPVPAQLDIALEVADLE